MDCYILHTVLLMTVLLFVIDVLTIYKMENNEIKEFSVKNRTCYYFDDIITNVGKDLIQGSKKR